jgi:hypothetical protein
MCPETTLGKYKTKHRNFNFPKWAHEYAPAEFWRDFKTIQPFTKLSYWENVRAI